MYTLLKPLQVREELLARNLRVFTPREFSRVFTLPSYKVKYFLERESAGGFLVRLKQGLYGMKTDLPREEEIANRLYRPSYISFEYALAYYGILPEMPYAVTSATTKPTRVFSAQDRTFQYFTIKMQAYTGYTLVKQDGAAYFIAEPEKALVDYLYFVVLGKKPPNERLNIASLNKEKMRTYARLYARGELLKRIGVL